MTVQIDILWLIAINVACLIGGAFSHKWLAKEAASVIEPKKK